MCIGLGIKWIGCWRLAAVDVDDHLGVWFYLWWKGGHFSLPPLTPNLCLKKLLSVGGDSETESTSDMPNWVVSGDFFFKSLCVFVTFLM